MRSIINSAQHQITCLRCECGILASLLGMVLIMSCSSQVTAKRFITAAPATTPEGISATSSDPATTTAAATTPTATAPATTDTRISTNSATTSDTSTPNQTAQPSPSQSQTPPPSPSPSPSATPEIVYYIDFVGGLDSNNGTSVAAPWQHVPGDATACASYPNTCGHPTPIAGTAYLFKGGIAYTNQINMNWSGSSGNPIVYDGNSAGTFGTGKAIIDRQNAGYFGFSNNNNGVSNITINNFEIRNIGYPNPAGNWIENGIYFGNGNIATVHNNNITISNNYIHNVGYWTNDGSVSPAGSCIEVQGGQASIDIHGNEATKCGGSGIGLASTSHAVVVNNNIHDYITWGIDIAPTDTTTIASGNDIRGNTIHDLYQYDCGFWGNGCSDPDIPHTDYVFIRQGSPLAPRPDGNIVERNLFYNDYSFTTVGGTAMVFMSFADNTIVRNNVFLNAHSYYTVEPGWSSKGTRIFNNTFYSSTPINYWGSFSGNGLDNLSVCNHDANLYQLQIDGAVTPNTFEWRQYSNGAWGSWQQTGVQITGSCQSVGTASISFNSTTGHTLGDNWTIGGNNTVVENNIFVLNGSVYSLGDKADADELISNYNVKAGSGVYSTQVIPYTSWTLAQWQGAGYDAHSSVVTAASNVGFSDISGYPNSCESVSLRFTSGPALATGANLSTFFSDDFSGAVRPASGAWSMGAYGQ